MINAKLICALALLSSVSQVCYSQDCKVYREPENYNNNNIPLLTRFYNMAEKEGSSDHILLLRINGQMNKKEGIYLKIDSLSRVSLYILRNDTFRLHDTFLLDNQEKEDISALKSTQLMNGYFSVNCDNLSTHLDELFVYTNMKESRATEIRSMQGNLENGLKVDRSYNAISDLILFIKLKSSEQK